MTKIFSTILCLFLGSAARAGEGLALLAKADSQDAAAQARAACMKARFQALDDCLAKPHPWNTCKPFWEAVEKRAHECDVAPAKYKPGDKPNCGGKNVVVYQNSVKVGGSPGWRNNNPGVLTCFSGIESYGSYPCQGFAVFPDFATGGNALTRWVQENGTKTIKQFV